MKKLIMTFIFATVSLGIHAQISKGTFLLGGSVGFNSTNSNSTTNGVTTPISTSTSFGFFPQAGYFFTDHIAAGMGLSFSTTSNKQNASSSSSNSTQFTLSPFVRYYFPQKIYLQGGLDAGSVSASSTTLIGWTLLGGYPVFLNESIAVEPQIGYKALTNKIDSSNKTTTGDFFVRVGFQIYLKKK